MTSPRRDRPGNGAVSCLHRAPSRWTRDEIRQARQTPLQPVLELLGYRLLPRPDGNFAIADMPPETCPASGETCHAKGVIIIKEHYWNCPDSGQSGNAIDFFVKIRGASFNEAMKWLIPS